MTNAEILYGLPMNVGGEPFEADAADDVPVRVPQVKAEPGTSQPSAPDQSKKGHKVCLVFYPRFPSLFSYVINRPSSQHTKCDPSGHWTFHQVRSYINRLQEYWLIGFPKGSRSWALKTVHICNSKIIRNTPIFSIPMKVSVGTVNPTHLPGLSDEHFAEIYRVYKNLLRPSQISSEASENRYLSYHDADKFFPTLLRISTTSELR